MKNKGKKLLSLLLVAVIVVSVAVTGVVSFGAYDVAPPNQNRLPEYTPSAGVKTNNIYFAMPGAWIGAEEGFTVRQTWEKYGSTAGIYWWGSLDNPDEAPAAAGHGWPGWKMKKNETIENLYSSHIPKGTASMIFDNFIDSGMDTSYPEYAAAQQTKDLTDLEYLGEGSSDYYPKEFWDYIYDNYYEELADDPNYQIEEFGNYAKNFIYSEEDDSIFHSIDDMVFVVDTVNTVRAQVSPVSGKVGLDGAFYFYYGNGEFGIWPTKEMCIEKEGLKTNEAGDVDVARETKQDKTDFVIRNRTDAYDSTTNREFVVFGNFTEKYWQDSSLPPALEPETQPATSSSSSGSGDSEGSGYTHPEPSTINIIPPSGSGNKVYFYADPSLWKNYKTFTMYFYEHGGDTLITWGSKKGNMTDEGNNIWSFDFDQKYITLDPDKQYGIIFTADWNQQTCDIIFDTSCLGDIAFCPGDLVENNVDSSYRKSLWVWWNNADPSKCAPPLCITSIGNLIGYVLWDGQTKYSILVDFIKSDGKDGLKNALKYNEKTCQQTIDDLAGWLGLTDDDVKRAIAESGKSVDWRPGSGSNSGEQFDDNVKDVADYILRYSGNPKMSTPKKIRELMNDLEVTDFELVKKALFYRCNGDFDTFIAAEEVLNRANTDFMNVVKGDTNGDGVVDVIDATRIQMFAVGKITSFG